VACEAQEKGEAMCTGTLIEDLIAAVERAEARTGAVQIHTVRTETGIKDNDTGVIPVGCLNADYDIDGPVGRTASPDEDFPLPLPACGQCPPARQVNLGAAAACAAGSTT